MAERKGGSARKDRPRSRADRSWKDATNPTVKRDVSSGDPRAAEGDATDDLSVADHPPMPSPRRAQAGREDQGLSWQTGPGSGGATQSAGRVKEHEARSGQARPKK
jgi:hypothetical protein